MVFVRSWMLFRVCADECPNFLDLICIPLSQLAVISQGIAARYARRQASSETAYKHVFIFPMVGNLAKKVLVDEGIKIGMTTKL
jgi:hypothetical protein